MPPAKKPMPPAKKRASRARVPRTPRSPPAAARSRGRGRTAAPAAGQHTMYVCRSCVWSEAEREIDGKRQGTFLVEAMEARRAEQGAGAVAMRVVFCLGGCRSPCNVAYRCPGKTALRFNRLTPDDAQALIDFAHIYAASATGDIPPEARPAALRENLIVRVPPPPR